MIQILLTCGVVVGALVALMSIRLHQQYAVIASRQATIESLLLTWARSWGAPADQVRRELEAVLATLPAAARRPPPNIMGADFGVTAISTALRALWRGES